MYVVTVEFEIEPEKLDEFRRAMLEQAKNSLELEEHCRQFDVCFATDEPTRCFLYETYDDKTAFNSHLESRHFLQFNDRVSPWVVAKHVRTWKLTF